MIRWLAGLVLAAALVAVLGGLAACGAKTEDLRYREARELPALRVPPDLDRPRETALMKIPPRPSDAKPDSAPVSAPVSDAVSEPVSKPASSATDGDLSRPPNILTSQ